jgi:hypothetical protein
LEKVSLGERYLWDTLPANQNYSVFKVTTLNDRKFTVYGQNFEEIFDLKKRIETIEGIPPSS